MFHSNVYCVISQICANIMEYCQTLLLQSSAEAQFSLCLFSPSASEPAGWSLWLFMSVYVDKILAGSCKTNCAFPCASCWIRCVRSLCAGAQSGIGFAPTEEQRHWLLPIPWQPQTEPEQARASGTASSWGTQGGIHANTLLPFSACLINIYRIIYAWHIVLCAKLCQGLVSGSGGVEKIPSVQRNVLAKRRLVQLVNNRAKLLALCSCILTHKDCLRNQEMLWFAF